MPRGLCNTTLDDSNRCCGVLSDWSRCSEEKDIPDQFCISHPDQSHWYNSDVTSEERLAHAQGGKCIGLDKGGQNLCRGYPYSGHFTTCSYHADQAPPSWTKPAKSPTSDNLIYLDIYQM